MASEAEANDWLIPFPKPPREIGEAKSFRTTWLISSMATIKERGRFHAYEAALSPEHREKLLTAVPGVWVPMAVARAHYVACETLGFSDQEIIENGGAAMRRANGTSIAFVVRAARGAGVTPWTALTHASRMWLQTWDDGAMAVRRMGPKEAQLEIVGCPLANVRYNRLALRGIFLAGVELFCQKAYAREIPALATQSTLGFRLSWA